MEYAKTATEHGKQKKRKIRFYLTFMAFIDWNTNHLKSKILSNQQYTTL